MTEQEQARRVGRLLVGLYDLAAGLGWRWDDERQVWVDAQGEEVLECCA